MPGCPAPAFVRAAKRVLAGCQILLVVAPGGEEECVTAIEAGAAGCISDPGNSNELVQHALKLRDGGSPLCPFIARRLLERLHARAVLHAEAAALTSRESDVVHLLANGLSYAQIGDRLGVSLNTVGSHIKNAYRKLDVHSATAAVMRVAELQMPGKASGQGHS
jgi:DNA-binding NarL/FixJ family response regulator